LTEKQLKWRTDQKIARFDLVADDRWPEVSIYLSTAFSAK